MRSCCPTHPDYRAGCPDCQRYAREYAYRRHWGLYGGTWDRMVEGDELEAVKAHVVALCAHAGVTVPLIAAAAGTGHSNVYRLTGGRTMQMRPDVAHALMGVTPELALRGRVNAFVDSIGAARRLRALAADDWSSDALSPLCGVNPVTLSHWRSRQRPMIRVRSHQTVVELYDKIRALADPRGPSEMAGRRAREFGYLPPERWADEDLDDPNAEPLPPAPDGDDWVAVTNMIEDALRNPAPGRAADFPRSVKLEIARHAHGRLGWSHPRIAELLGYASESHVGYLLNGRKDRRRVRG